MPLLFYMVYADFADVKQDFWGFLKWKDWEKDSVRNGNTFFQEVTMSSLVFNFTGISFEYMTFFLFIIIWIFSILIKLIKKYDKSNINDTLEKVIVVGILSIILTFVFFLISFFLALSFILAPFWYVAVPNLDLRDSLYGGHWSINSSLDTSHFALEAFLDTSKAYQDWTSADTSSDTIVDVSGLVSSCSAA